MNVIVPVEFKFANENALIQHVSHYVMKVMSKEKLKEICKNKENYKINIFLSLEVRIPSRAQIDLFEK